MIGKVVFIIAGIMCISVGLVSALIVVDMFQHPGGIGAEKLMGPVVGLVALVFLLRRTVFVRCQASGSAAQKPAA